MTWKPTPLGVDFRLPMDRLKNFALTLFLALAVLAGQQAVLRHGLSHATEQLSRQQDGKTRPAACDLCFHCAQLSGGAAAGGIPEMPLLEACVQVARSAPAAAPAYRFLAFDSRAPPARL